MAEISAVIPTYNRGSVLTEAIDSVLAQTSAVDEIIVVDDGSTDDTLERLRTYGGRIRLITQQHQGQAAARGAGVEASRGEWIALLDSDDLWHPDKIRRQREQFGRAPQDVGVLYTRYSIEGPGFKRLSPRPPREGALRIEDLLKWIPIAASSLVLRKACLKAAGGFRSKIARATEWDLLLRMSLAGVAFRYIDEPLVRYRISEDSLVREDVQDRAVQVLGIVDDFYRREDLPQEVAALYPASKAHVLLKLSHNCISRGKIGLAADLLRQSLQYHPLLALRSGLVWQILLGIALGHRPYRFLRNLRRNLLRWASEEDETC